MRDEFAKFLIRRGYKTETPSGNPSTVYAYLNSMDWICSEEHLSWRSLAENIDGLLVDYDVGGRKQHEGEKSHRTVINALKRFSEFIKEKP